VQPLRVLYVRTEAGRERLLPLMNDRNRDKTATAPAVAVLAVDARFHDHVPVRSSASAAACRFGAVDVDGFRLAGGAAMARTLGGFGFYSEFVGGSGG
jgi:hypothetical protein